MFTTALISWLWSFAGPLVQSIPDITIEDMAWSRTFLDFFNMALYFFPLDTVQTILGIIWRLWLLRIAVSILKTIWDALPVV